MSWSLLNSGGSGYLASGGADTFSLPGGAPAAGRLEILWITSGSTITTAGAGGGAAWTQLQSYVHSQASYLYYRVTNGSEGSSIAITMSSQAQTSVEFMRWSGQAASSPLDVSNIAGDSGANNAFSPSVSSGTLAGTGELAVAFSGTSNPGNSTPTLTGWTAGWTDDGSGPQYFYWTGQDSQFSYAAYQVNAGTAAVSASASWTFSAGGGADSATGIAAFKAAPAGPAGSKPGGLVRRRAAARAVTGHAYGRVPVVTLGPAGNLPGGLVRRRAAARAVTGHAYGTALPPAGPAGNLPGGLVIRRVPSARLLGGLTTSAAPAGSPVAGSQPGGTVRRRAPARAITARAYGTVRAASPAGSIQPHPSVARRATARACIAGTVVRTVNAIPPAGTVQPRACMPVPRRYPARMGTWAAVAGPAKPPAPPFQVARSVSTASDPRDGIPGVS